MIEQIKEFIAGFASGVVFFLLMWLVYLVISFILN